MSKKKKKRKKQQQSARSSGGGGSMMSMRSGMKNLVGKSKKKAVAPKSTLQKIWDVAFWVLLAAFVGYFLYKRFGGAGG